MLKAAFSLFVVLFSGTCHAMSVTCDLSGGSAAFSPAGPWPFDTIVVSGVWVPFGGFAIFLPSPMLVGASAQVQGNTITLDMYGSDTALPPGIQPTPRPGVYASVPVKVRVGPLAPGSYTMMTALHEVDETGAISDPCGPAAVSKTVTIEQATGPVETLTAVEFYDPALDHYFITANAAEIEALNNGAFPGWVLTGQSFNVFAPAKSGGVGVPVCRFYGLPSAGLDSHFYTADQAECASIPTTFHGTWQLESTDVFDIRLPDPATGYCALGFVPVYRMWNQRTDSNHRFTTDIDVATFMNTRGYVSEGWGLGRFGVAMCALQRAFPPL